MATAQQLIVNGLIALINSNPNINGLVLATSPSAGCLRLTTKTADAPRVNYNSGASHVTGAGIFTDRQDAGPPATADLYFSWTLIPGNTVAINIGSGARSLDLHYQLPTATVVDVGGFDYRSSLGGGSSVVLAPGGVTAVIPAGGTPAPNPAVQPSTRAVTPTDRRLVVMECGSASPEFGELFALAPTNATAVPIPAFRFGTAKPSVGSAVGEAFYETTSRKGWVWDGSAWREIAATPLRTYATEADLIADAGEVTGTYAIATDTGALFVKRTTGWAYIGIRDYTTTGALLADTQSTGALGLALDDDTLWQMTPTGWRALSIRHLADTAAVQAWANPAGTPAGTNPQGAALGDQAMDLAHEVMYVRTASGWKPETIWEETEANIRAATWCLVGQEAIATDTGRTFAYTTAGWVEEPIQHYATEALLLAATSQNGTLAWADDTNVVFTRAAGTWHRLQGPQISVGTTAPTTPGTGDLWYDSASNRLTLNIYNGTAWISTTGVTVGGTGAKVILPGYFNEDPSATATADDIGGLAFKYSGNTTQLFLNKGNLWHPMTPMLGVAANAGKPIVADASGNASWGDPIVERQRVITPSGTREFRATLTPNAAVRVSFKGFVRCTQPIGQNFTVRPYIETTAGVHSLSTATLNADPSALLSWTNDGISTAGNDYFTTHNAGFLFVNRGGTDAKAGYPVFVWFDAYRIPNEPWWMVTLRSHFRTSNDTPVTFDASFAMNLEGNAIVKAGADISGFAGNETNRTGDGHLIFNYF